MCNTRSETHQKPSESAFQTPSLAFCFKPHLSSLQGDRLILVQVQFLALPALAAKDPEQSLPSSDSDRFQNKKTYFKLVSANKKNSIARLLVVGDLVLDHCAVSRLDCLTPRGAFNSGPAGEGLAQVRFFEGEGLALMSFFDRFT